MRGAVRQRLSPADDGAKSTAADIRGVCERVDSHACGSMLEADLLWLRLARDRVPAELPAAIERLRPWCVRLTEDEAAMLEAAPVEHWLEGFGGSGSAVLPAGLFVDKASASAYARLLTSLAEVCSYASIVRETTSEEDAERVLAEHREGLRAALAWTGIELVQRLGNLDGQIERASAELRFEEAAKLNEARSLAAKLPERRLTCVGPQDQTGWIAIAPEPSDRKLVRMVRVSARGAWRSESGVSPDAGAVGAAAGFEGEDEADGRVCAANLGVLTRFLGDRQRKSLALVREGADDQLASELERVMGNP